MGLSTLQTSCDHNISRIIHPPKNQNPSSPSKESATPPKIPASPPQEPTPSPKAASPSPQPPSTPPRDPSPLSKDPAPTIQPKEPATPPKTPSPRKNPPPSRDTISLPRKNPALPRTTPMPRSLSAVSSLEVRDLNRDQIRFYHPGYLKPLNLLFCLPRVDYSPADGVFGVHHLTALTACQIIANNAFGEGYLARDEKGKDRVSTDDKILMHRDYWFFMDGDERYPIVPSFKDWQFPHDRLPDWWTAPTSTQGLINKRCAITNTSYAFTWAHLIPREETQWFNKNGMGLYGGGSHTIDDPHNILPLKADLYVCFDQSVFALIPKPSDRGSPNGVEPQNQYVLHVLDGRESEFTALYQNRPVESLVEGSREYLFARFAWSIFSYLKPFLASGVGRRVVRHRLKAADDDAEEEHLISEMQNIFLDSRKLESLYGGGHKRRVSLEDSYVEVEEWDDEHPGRTEMEA